IVAGFACSITMTSLLFSTVLVWTFVSLLVLSVPLVWAFARIRCTASNTSCCWERKAFPMSVVHWIFDANRSTASGTAAMDWMLGSHGCFATASVSALPFKLLFLSIHCFNWMTSSG